MEPLQNQFPPDNPSSPPLTPPPTNIPGHTLPHPPAYPVPNPKFYLLKLVCISFALLMSIGSIGYYFLSHLPKQAMAKEYLENISQDFNQVQAQLFHFLGAFTEVSDSLTTSKEAFYEITTSRHYFEAVSDTKKDIEDIQSTLTLIELAKDHQSNNPPPPEFIDLDQKLTDYYQASLEGLTLLLEFEQLQLAMLEASGDDLNTQIASVSAIFTSQTQWATASAYFAQVSILAQEATTRFEQITDIPSEHLYYYQTMFEYHQDLAQTSQTLARQLQASTHGDGQEFLKTFSEFSERNIDRNSKREADTRQMVEQSPIQTWFAKAAALQEEISSSLSILLQKYGVEPTTPSPTSSSPAQPEATTSANLPEATSSATPTTPQSKFEIDPIPEATDSTTLNQSSSKLPPNEQVLE